jgi:hypothetical protein
MAVCATVMCDDVEYLCDCALLMGPFEFPYFVFSLLCLRASELAHAMQVVAAPQHSAHAQILQTVGSSCMQKYQRLQHRDSKID